MEPCISMKKFWEQVFLGFHGKNHLFQRKSGYSDLRLSIPCQSRDRFLKKFWEQVFLGFRGSYCSNVKAAVHIFAQVFSASRVKISGNSFREIWTTIQTCPPKFRLELTILQIVSKRVRERRYTKTGILTLAISHPIVCI